MRTLELSHLRHVLVELPSHSDLKRTVKRLERSGFTMMSDEGERISLNLGYTKDGFAKKVYHVHLRLVGDNGQSHVPPRPGRVSTDEDLLAAEGGAVGSDALRRDAALDEAGDVAPLLDLLVSAGDGVLERLLAARVEDLELNHHGGV